MSEPTQGLESDVGVDLAAREARLRSTQFGLIVAAFFAGFATRLTWIHEKLADSVLVIAGPEGTEEHLPINGAELTYSGFDMPEMRNLLMWFGAATLLGLLGIHKRMFLFSAIGAGACMFTNMQLGAFERSQAMPTFTQTEWVSTLGPGPDMFRYGIWILLITLVLATVQAWIVSVGELQELCAEDPEKAPSALLSIMLPNVAVSQMRMRNPENRSTSTITT